MSDVLPTLAIETSGSLCSVALLLSEREYYQSEIKQKHIHSQKLFSLIDVVMKEANFGIHNLSSIAVSMGPGSFTGLRIGLAAAKGLAFGSKLPIVPVPTFEAMAHFISRFLIKDQKFLIANEVNRTEIYLARFRKKDESYLVEAQLSLYQKSEFDTIVSKDEMVFGDFSNKKITQYAFPTAINIAEWAYLFGKDFVTFDHDYLEPNYLKMFVAKVKK